MTPASRPHRRALALAATAIVAVAAAVFVFRQLTPLDDNPPPAVHVPRKPSLADKSPDELRTALMTQADVPKYLTISTQNKNPEATQSANPSECLPRLLSEHGQTVVTAHAYAPDFSGMFYDGRYAAELILRPKEGQRDLVDFAHSWLARCVSFSVSLTGSAEQYPAYTVPFPADVPGNEGSLGLKVIYAFAKSDPFRNQTFYWAAVRVRGIDVLVLSGLPGVSEDLAAKAVAKLAEL
ncbi:hypothetical protein Srot_1383 [Segniliparus rotundus DSM 44985]|uniref:Uncharacterized protein n=1 Tax=Segniliparus rotundus (strain ATCC BAA-972 / CDC 1076 / CIP 108378 / DSM 44985 / JCM 13578) TaxID=640132 RepID=D6Z7B7_SEGRD|nr:hypothetical protein [Segniliparus rotundus]ADG97847.1 hypothetical protein Srot_1383 [Segniliparus rotundus DSM 44985]